MTETPVIEIKNLYKYFDKTPVIKGMHLTIYKGETLVIIGRSGCGKSVLLKHIIGILKPDKGSIFVNNKDITKMNERQVLEEVKQFGMLFQGAALFDSLSVAENIAFGLTEHTQLSQKEIDKRVTDGLSVVGLAGIHMKKPAELSGGMKKRVALARAIAMNPHIILYDEPTTGLDPIMADTINELIIKLKKNFSVTSIAVTHDMVSAYKIADRIAMLYDGKIIEIGTPEQIKASTNSIVQQFITGKADGPIV